MIILVIVIVIVILLMDSCIFATGSRSVKR